jgi:hypothetical protein
VYDVIWYLLLSARKQFPALAVSDVLRLLARSVTSPVSPLKCSTLCTLAGAPLLMFVQLMVTRKQFVITGSVGMRHRSALRKGEPSPVA